MSVNKLRKKVDGIDRRILELLNERALASKRIGRLKAGQGVYAPHREKEVLDRLKALNKGPLTPAGIEAIYREIMSFSISLKKKVKISYLGPPVTYTHQAAQKKFGSSVEYEPCGSISDVFADVERERSEYGVVPVENSTEGAVNHTLDLFVDSPLMIYAEIYLPIHHNLMSIGNPLKSVTQVYSNPQVFGQCRLWLESNLRGANLVDTASTAEAAQIAANNANREGIACIASEVAAAEYGLEVLASQIEDNPNNTTRFLVIARSEAEPTRRDRTSLVFALQDRAGALHDILVPFKKQRINLTKIESRPSKKKAWNYYFFVDFEGHRAEARVKKALKALEAHCTFLKVLGSYPRA
ncbi:MAG: chorismate mutase [Omnitrophica bacterium RIFCSPHIGHO2_02_FULL_63_14]|nr:MAG: chorismate mutase [Omnitrophica bacterium RIFCSPHIGHO2_02_FULL_63_14]